MALDFLVDLGVYLLKQTLLTTAEYVMDRTRTSTAKAMNEENEVSARIKSALQTSIDQLKDTLKRRLDSLAESNLRAAISYVKDALIIIQTHDIVDGMDPNIQKDFVPKTLKFNISDDAIEQLKQARAWAQLAFSDHENVSIPMRIEAVKVQIFCILLLFKDEPKKCSLLITERITSLFEDHTLKIFMDRKISWFSFFNKQVTLDAKNAVASFARHLMRALPNLHRLGYGLKDVPAFMNILTTQACIPVGWWEGHPVVWVNGTMMSDVPWASKILVGDFVGKTKLLDLDTFEFQKTFDVTLELNSILDEQLKEIYSNQNLFKWNEKKNSLKFKSNYEKGVSYSNSKLKKSRIKGPLVSTPSQHAVILTSDGLFVRWALQLVNNEGMDHLLTNDFKKSVQMFIPIETDSVHEINRLLWAEDYKQDKIALYAFKFGPETVPEVCRYIISRDSTYADFERLFTVPGVNPNHGPDFYHDLLQWSDINDAIVGISLNKHGVFQLRLVDIDGNALRHSMVEITNFTIFPPTFRWKAFEENENEVNKVHERTVYKRSAIIKNNCIYICRPFEYSLIQQQMNTLNAEVIEYQSPRTQPR